MHWVEGGTRNNGDLSIAWTIMSKRGWRSKETLETARRELEHYGFIRLTRQGGRNRPNLYAVTFFAIDDYDGKLDCAPTHRPPDDWKQTKKRFVSARQRRQKSNEKRISCPDSQDP